VNTSTRCAGLVLASLAVIILNLAAQTSHQALRSPPNSEGDARTPLTLELRELGFDGVTPAATGRPGYHPSPMLKLYIYGYLNRVQSSRRLEREAGRNLDLPALLSFDGIIGVHHCLVHDINAFGACLSAQYYMFANDFDLSFSGFHGTFACRVAWRRATLCGVVFVLRRRAPKPVSAKVELASIIQLNRPDALRGGTMRSSNSAVRLP
jgi:hypothetical protein